MGMFCIFNFLCPFYNLFKTFLYPFDNLFIFFDSKTQRHETKYMVCTKLYCIYGIHVDTKQNVFGIHFGTKLSVFGIHVGTKLYFLAWLVLFTVLYCRLGWSDFFVVGQTEDGLNQRSGMI